MAVVGVYELVANFKEMLVVIVITEHLLSALGMSPNLTQTFHTNAISTTADEIRLALL